MTDATSGPRPKRPVQVPLTYQRVFALEDIHIIARGKGGGDGRTVEAYAAVFGVPTEIHDQHGDYIEDVDPSAFKMSINSGAAMRASVLLNHGYDVRGGTGGMQQTELGSPVSIVADTRGLLTVSRYNDGPFTEQVLAGIRNGDYRAQSFEGPIFRSTPQRPPGRAKPGAALPKVRRMELGLRNYGPTKNPYYPQAEITAVRSAAEIAADIAQLDEASRAQLIEVVSATPGFDKRTAQILATPSQGAGAEEPPQHSTRQHLLRLKTELAFLGME